MEGTLAVPGCTTELAQHLARLAPFGPGNEEPVLILPRARVVRADRVGKEGATIRAFVEGEGGGTRLKAVAVPRQARGRWPRRCWRARAVPLHLAGHLRAEEWNGSLGVAFVVHDAAAA